MGKKEGFAQLSRLENASEKTSDVTEPQRRVGSERGGQASQTLGSKAGVHRACDSSALRDEETEPEGQGRKEGQTLDPE